MPAQGGIAPAALAVMSAGGISAIDCTFLEDCPMAHLLTQKLLLLNGLLTPLLKLC
jgi:hypothetical protein